MQILSHTLAALLMFIPSDGLPAVPAAHPTASSSHPIEAPSRIEAKYEVSTRGLHVIDITETFTRSGDNYTLESVSVAVGWLVRLFKPETIRVTSAGTLTPQGLRPGQYAQVRSMEPERNTRAEFNWGKKQVSLTYRGGGHVESLAAGTQDRLSAMYQLMFLPLQDMRELKLLMYNNGTRIDDYSYHITPNISVSVPFRNIQALYLATEPEKDGKRTEIWVDTEHHFPYKLVITDHDGSKYTQVLTDLKFTQ